jgi:hypothetical protein
MRSPSLAPSFCLAAALALGLALPGCARPQGAVGRLRFANAAPVWKVHDRLPIAQPAEQGFAKVLYYFDQFFFRRLTNLMALRPAAHAANVNALDEVPDSTWFTNRIGVRELTVDEVRRGPNVDDGPDRSAPWVITGTKIGGSSVGLLMRDARGVKYILKFDLKGVPDMETAADVIVQRLFWAAGYNTPEDTIVFFPRDQLTLSPDAKVSDTFGNKRPMTERDLEAALARVDLGADGQYRGLASKFLGGRPVGGASNAGTREDDPNDRIPHEERRDLRGAFAIFSWVDHTDVKLDNSLDMYVEDPDEPANKFVVHYLLDFGKALGAMGWIERRPEDGFGYYLDFEYMLYAMPALGLWKRPWEDASGAPVRGVGRIESKWFDPGSWRPQYPWDPFTRSDRFDKFWGAKIVMRFSPAQIRAAVEQGRYEDPRATDYITQTLIERQRKIGRYWFTEVAPIDRVEVTRRDGGLELCFADLAAVYALEPDVADTRYLLEVYAYDGSALGELVRAQPGTARDAGRTACATLPVPLPAARDGYAIVSIATQRPRRMLPPVDVHLARGPDGAPRVIGIERR